MNIMKKYKEMSDELKELEMDIYKIIVLSGIDVTVWNIVLHTHYDELRCSVYRFGELSQTAMLLVKNNIFSIHENGKYDIDELNIILKELNKIFEDY